MARRQKKKYPDTLEGFASRVSDVCAEMLARRSSGTFGDDKVFTHAAWAIGRFDEPLTEFKRRLLEAHRERLLTLARADLVEAMDPYDVKRSKIEHHNSEWNFIKI